MVRRHGPMVLATCRGVLRHEHDAEDAFQTTFLVLARRAGSIRKPASLASFLHGVAWHIARKTRRGDRHAQPLGEEAVRSSTTEPSCEAAWRELGRIVEEEVQALPEKYRTPILLCYWQGLTGEETACRLG